MKPSSAFFNEVGEWRIGWEWAGWIVVIAIGAVLAVAALVGLAHLGGWLVGIFLDAVNA